MAKFSTYQFIRGRSLFTKIAAVFLLLFSCIAFFLIRNFVEVVYSDDNVGQFISFSALFLVTYFPVVLSLAAFIIIVKVIIDRLSFFGSSKNHIRFNLVITFFGILIISFFIYISIFQFVFNQTLDYVDDRTSIGMKKMLKERRQFTEERLKTMQKTLETQRGLIISGKISLKETGFDNVFFYDMRDASLHALRQSVISPKALFLIQELKSARDGFERDKNFSRFVLEEKAFIVGSFTDENRMLVAITYDKSDLSARVSDIIYILQNSNNFQILKPIMTKLFIISFLYFYLPVFLLGLIVYFFISYQLLIPINAVSEFSREFAERYLGARIRTQDGSEVSQLVESYKKMMRSFSKKRRQDKMIAEYEAWKGIAVRIAHEIKNPLTPIQLAADDIEERIRGENPSLYFDVYSQFKTIEDKIEFIRKLIKEFSDFSKNIEIELEAKKLWKIRNEIKEEVENFQNLEDVELVFVDGLKKGDLKLEAQVNFERLRQVLTNLIGNSIDSLNSSREKEKTIEIRLFSRDARLLLWVVDNGAGIQSEERQKIFEPYFTKKASGTGLGLAICREIIIRHRGMIWATSEEGKTFIKISIPLSFKKAPPPKNKKK